MAFIFICIYQIHADAKYVWDNKLPLPEDDLLWEKVRSMWEDRWGGENIDEIISILHQLETKHKNRIEPYLWLGKSYYIKGRFNPKLRTECFKK